MISMEEMYDRLDAELDTFQWGFGDTVLGEMVVDREAGNLVMTVYCSNTDTPDDPNVVPLKVTVSVNQFQDPKEQIRAVIHYHLCHEADEQMWFDNERTFYPHEHANA